MGLADCIVVRSYNCCLAILTEVYSLESSQHGSLRHTLKEWAVAVRALERGETALVVRGGIREKAFAIKDSSPACFLATSTRGRS